MGSAGFQLDRREAISLCGQHMDPVCAGYHLGNGYRMYLPSLMRFAAPDTLSPFGAGGINPYVYCDDDPGNRRDPNGHFPLFALAIVSTLIGTAGSFLGFAAINRGEPLRAAVEANQSRGLRGATYTAYGTTAFGALSIPISIASAVLPGAPAVLGAAMALGGLSLLGSMGTLVAIDDMRRTFAREQEAALGRFSGAGAGPASGGPPSYARAIELQDFSPARGSGPTGGHAAPDLPTFEQARTMPRVAPSEIVPLPDVETRAPPGYQPPTSPAQRNVRYRPPSPPPQYGAITSTGDQVAAGVPPTYRGLNRLRSGSAGEIATSEYQL